MTDNRIWDPASVSADARIRALEAENERLRWDEDLRQVNERLEAKNARLRAMLTAVVRSGEGAAQVGGRWEDVPIARGAYDDARAALADGSA